MIEHYRTIQNTMEQRGMSQDQSIKILPDREVKQSQSPPLCALSLSQNWQAQYLLQVPTELPITDGQGIAKLYFRHIFPLFGIPKWVISDRNPRFTSHFAKAVCRATGIKQNLSITFHPYTDGQSEQMNQWVETYLCQFTNACQNNWSDLLPMAEYAHCNGQLGRHLQ